MAGGDAKMEQRLTRFASPLNVYKSWAAAQQKISSGEMIRARPDGTDPQALNEWRAQAQIPEKPEGYLEKVPGGLVFGEAEKPIVDTFLKSMHDKDAPPAFVHEALTWYKQNQEQQIAARTESDKANRVTNEESLRSEWGPEYRPNLNSAMSLLKTYGNEEIANKFFAARTSDGNLLGDDPQVLRMLVSLSKELNPAGTVVPAPGQNIAQTIDSELESLTAMMKNRNGEYYRGAKAEGHQARFRELIDMKQRLSGRAA